MYTEERREQEIPAGEEADEQEISAGEEADEQEIPAGEEADAQEQDVEAADQDRPGGFLCTKIQRKDLGSCPTTVSCFTAIIITITWYFWTTGNGSGWECRESTIQRSRRRRKPSGFRNSSGEETLQWSWKKKSGKKTTDSDTGAGASGGRGRESSVSMREKIPWKNRKKMKNI